jgi:N-acyl-D-amino-acid deacylase
MNEGAVGLSTGLIYLPGTFTKTEEIIALAKIVGAHGGIYTSHMRHEDYRIEDAIAEVIRVAREAHVAAEVSHIKLGGPRAWGHAAETLAQLARARAEGIAITQDEYVYTASSTGLGVNTIDAEFLEGGRDQFRARLADPQQKARMIAGMKHAVETERRGDYT